MSEYSGLPDSDKFSDGETVRLYFRGGGVGTLERPLELRAATVQEFVDVDETWLSLSSGLLGLAMPWSIEVGDMVVYAIILVNGDWSQVAMPWRIWTVFEHGGEYDVRICD